MHTNHHHRGFLITTLWTLVLLLLGSIVHATESSLACPDWPTCYGSIVPEMSGGIFWEHLHRLVAGGLVLIFAATTYVGWSALSDRPTVRWAAVAGIVLLFIQSAFGGITVLLQLPDAISTTHLALAFLFLALTTALAVVTAPSWEQPGRAASLRLPLRRFALVGAGLTFAQSILGAAVRHTDAGLVCPDFPRCLGQWVPPLTSLPVTLHFFHRLSAVTLVVVIAALALFVARRFGPSTERTLAVAAAGTVVVQFGLGILSVTTRLAVPWVSLHTLFAATLLSLLVWLAMTTWQTGRATSAHPSHLDRVANVS